MRTLHVHSWAQRHSRALVRLLDLAWRRERGVVGVGILGVKARVVRLLAHRVRVALGLLRRHERLVESLGCGGQRGARGTRMGATVKGAAARRRGPRALRGRALGARAGETRHSCRRKKQCSHALPCALSSGVRPKELDRMANCTRVRAVRQRRGQRTPHSQSSNHFTNIDPPVRVVGTSDCGSVETWAPQHPSQ